MPPKPSLERIQAMLARRRWDYVPPAPITAPQAQEMLQPAAIAAQPSPSAQPGGFSKPQPPSAGERVPSPATQVPDFLRDQQAALEDVRRAQRLANMPAFDEQPRFENRPIARPRAERSPPRVHPPGNN